MLKIFKFIRLCLISLTILLNFFISCDNHNNFIQDLMELWTQIDLVRAINIDNKQKKKFIKDLYFHVISIYDKYDYLPLSNMGSEKIKEIEELIGSVMSHFEDVFGNINNAKTLRIYFILNKIFSSLKRPFGIESKISTNHISVKYAFTGNAIVIDNCYKWV